MNISLKKGVKTMPEYIEREAVLLQIDLHGTNKFGMLDEDIREFIKKQPAADVVEVKHGYWETKPNIGGHIVMMRCSVCAFQFDNWRHIFDYCPECGAKMDGERSGSE